MAYMSTISTGAFGFFSIAAWAGFERIQVKQRGCKDG